MTSAALRKLADEGSQTMRASIKRVLAGKPNENHSQTPRIQDSKPLERPEELAGDNEGKAQGTGRTALCFTLRRVKLLDPCAKYGSCKALIDGLRYAKIIRDDREEDITLEVRQEKVAHYTEEETVIEINIPE